MLRSLATLLIVTHTAPKNFEKNGNSDDKLPCHGKIGMIIDRAEATDMDSNGKPLGSRAENCFLVMFVDAKDLTPKVVHSQWLKLVDAEA